MTDLWEIAAADVRRRPEQVGVTTYTLIGVRDGKWGTFRTSDDLDEIRDFQANLPPEWTAGRETRILRTTVTCEQGWESEPSAACPACGGPMRTCGDPADGDGCGLDRCYRCRPAGTQPCDHK